jgi:2-(1,2-epoxy-1,2-dihydrophenyl)acetyl-CoA isomerase
MTDDVLVSIADRVALVTLNRPDAMNAVDQGMRRNLLGAFGDLARSPDVRAVVLTGAGRAFCSGSDLKSAASSPDSGPRRVARTLLHDFQPLIECIVRMDKPVIAAVNGAAVGVGMSLVLACDLVVMSETAYLLAPFVGLGLIPDGGLSWFLTRRLGHARTFELLAEGQKLPAARCQELGLVNRTATSNALHAAALQWAREFAARAPLAVALTKRAARQAASLGLSDALNLEAELQTQCAGSDDAREAIAAFKDRRDPVFQGR